MDYQALRQARKVAKKTQDDLAAHLGVNRATISKYETGQITPSLDHIRKIADFLNVSLGLLIGDDSIKTIELPGIEYPAKTLTQDEFARLAPAEQEYYSLRTLANFSPDLLSQRLTEAYNKLNAIGKVAAVIRVKELTECTKFVESDSTISPITVTIYTPSSDDSKKEPPQD